MGIRDNLIPFLEKNKRWAFPAVLLLALLVRLLGILSRPIWYDEAFAILFSEKGLKAMLAGTLTVEPGGAVADIHPLAYYTLLGGWMKAFGESLFSVRMLSILLGVGTVALVYLLLRSLFGNERLVLIGALAAALAPFLVHYSQEIRMYALMALALVGATYALWKGIHSKNVLWWILFSLCAALAQYTQNLSAFYLLPLAATPLFLRRWDKVKMTLLAGVGALVLYLPWLLQLPSQVARVGQSYWVERPGIAAVFSTLLAYVTNLPVAPEWLALALAGSLLVTLLAALQTYKALRRKLPGARKGLWLAYLAFTPPLLAFIFSQWIPVYIERAFLASGVLYWLWLAWAFTATPMPRLIKGFSLALVLMGMIYGLVTHVTYADFPYAPYQGLDASLEARLQPGDVIVHSNKLSMLPAVYYDRALEQHFIADPPAGSTDTLAPATQQVLGLAESPNIESAVGGAQRIWFIIYQKSLDEAAAEGLEAHPDLAWLDGHYRLDGKETWGSLLVYVYTR